MDELQFEDLLKQYSTDVPLPPAEPAMAAPIMPEPDMSRYDSDISKAKDDADRQRKMAYIAQAMQTMGMAHAVSRGMKPLSTGIYEELRADAGRPVNEAISAKDQALKTWLDKKRLDHQAEQAKYMRYLQEKGSSEKAALAAEIRQGNENQRGFNNQLALLNTGMKQADVAREIAKENESRSNKEAELKVPGAQIMPGYRPTADDAKKSKDITAAYSGLTDTIKAMDDLYAKSGTNYVGDDATTMETLQTNLQLYVKSLAELGVLSASDMGMINKLVVDPSSVGQNIKGMVGMDNYKAGSTSFKEIMKDRYESRLKASGYQPDGTLTKKEDPAAASAPVKLNLPDGRTVTVKADKAQKYIDQGATRAQ